VSFPKSYFVEMAYGALGYANYEFDVGPEQQQFAAKLLDAMMGAWDAKGVRVGWPIPSTVGGTSLDTETNCPDTAHEAIYTNLAIRIAATIGKTVSPETKTTAKSAYDQLMSLCAMPGLMVFPNTLPAGAGNKPWRNANNPFIQRPAEPLLSGPDGEIEFN
jgi:hypothetical protein